MRSNSGGSDIVSNESPCIDLVHRVSVFFCFQPLPSISFFIIHLYSFIVNVFACTFVSVVVLASPCSPYLFAIVNISFMNLKCVSSFFPFVSFFYLLTCGLTVTIHFSISCRIVCLMLDKRFHCFVFFFHTFRPFFGAELFFVWFNRITLFLRTRHFSHRDFFSRPRLESLLSGQMKIDTKSTRHRCVYWNISRIYLIIFFPTV